MARAENIRLRSVPDMLLQFHHRGREPTRLRQTMGFMQGALAGASGGSEPPMPGETTSHGTAANRYFSTNQTHSLMTRSKRQHSNRRFRCLEVCHSVTREYSLCIAFALD